MILPIVEGELFEAHLAVGFILVRFYPVRSCCDQEGIKRVDFIFNHVEFIVDAGGPRSFIIHGTILAVAVAIHFLLLLEQIGKATGRLSKEVTNLLASFLQGIIIFGFPIELETSVVRSLATCICRRVVIEGHGLLIIHGPI